MITNVVPIETVSKILGHNNIKTTQIYAQVFFSRLVSGAKSVANFSLKAY